MTIGFVNAGLGSEIIAAKYIDWQVIFAHTNYYGGRVIKQHFPDINVLQGRIPKKNVEILCGRTPGPAKASNSGPPKLDRNYLEVALQFFGIASQLSARWVVWETKATFLKSNSGKDFAQVLNKLGELGYGFAYRVLDAKYFGVPQTRRRLYLIGYRGDWRPASAVLFERTTSEEYFSKNRNKPTIVRTVEEASAEEYTILTHKLIKSSLVRYCPPLPFQKDLLLIGIQQSNPFLLISRKESRQLTPLEWERLQGLEDNFTKLNAPLQPFTDKTVYGLVGNAGCVPVYIWLFWRLQQVQKYIY